MSRAAQPKKLLARISWMFLVFIAASAALAAQSLPGQETEQPAPTISGFQKIEGTDPGTGLHYVRFLLSLPVAGDPQRAPRFTVECLDWKGKHDLLWYVSFGGVEDPGFVPPFEAGQNKMFAPIYPSVALKMRFEGYTKAKPSFTRLWTLLPNGEFRYHNPGPDSPNMDGTRYFMTYLESLPGLRIGRDKPPKGDPGPVFFATRPLLDELNKTPLCEP